MSAPGGPAAARCLARAMARRGVAVVAGAAWAALIACSAPPPEPVVQSVADGRTLVLSDGAEVRLAGLETPRPAEGRGAAEPFFAETRSALEAVALGRAIDFVGEEAPARDRWDRVVAHVEADGAWVQGRLLELGLARVEPDAASAPRLAEMLALEDAARRAEQGIWGSPYYAVRDAGAVSPAVGSFQIVEGVVVDAAGSGRWIYLNFGPDYRRDFTAAVAPEDRAAFDVDALLALSGARVRVRGWVSRRNGPFITLRHPGQLEVLD